MADDLPFEFRLKPVDQIPLFHRQRQRAHTEKGCATCQRRIDFKLDPEAKITHEGPIAFHDALSMEEYQVSYMCQGCQDIFMPPPEAENPDENSILLGAAPCGHFSPCNHAWLKTKPCELKAAE